ncbi:MAG: MltA domain-containing protein [Burkholderiales bacterium]|nr:MltA domain-containing protein [Burkholderiales bacterium]
MRYEPVAHAALPGWANASHARALAAFVAGCAALDAAHALSAACAAARALAPADDASARRFFEQAFDAYAVLAPDGAAEGLVTGYYEPVLAGSRRRSARFRYPVFGVPDDLVAVDLASVAPEIRHLRLRGRLEGRRLVPYWTRAEIEARGAEFPAPVLAWVEDPVELFFLHIQGSGQLVLEDGSRLRLAYADHNGHPYRSLGRHLVERGELAPHEASMQGIKAWAAANPGRLAEALAANASYVFFRELAAQGGPIGALGVPLTAGVSLAVDPRAIPLGAPVYLATTWPASARPLERLMVAQDTGGAIRGAVRADFFWGTGAEAGAQAGRMRERGRLWLLWPRGAPLP